MDFVVNFDGKCGNISENISANFFNFAANH